MATPWTLRRLNELLQGSKDVMQAHVKENKEDSSFLQEILQQLPRFIESIDVLTQTRVGDAKRFREIALNDDNYQFNERFQAALELTDEKARNAALTQISTDFIEGAAVRTPALTRLSQLPASMGKRSLVNVSGSRPC